MENPRFSKPHRLFATRSCLDRSRISSSTTAHHTHSVLLASEASTPLRFCSQFFLHSFEKMIEICYRDLPLHAESFTQSGYGCSDSVVTQKLFDACFTVLWYCRVCTKTSSILHMKALKLCCELPASETAPGGQRAVSGTT